MKIKLFLILSFFLFFGCENKIVAIDAPIEIKNLSKNLAIAEINPQKIKLKVTGYKSALDDLPLFKILYRIYLSDTKEGEIVLQTTEDAIELPPNVSIVEMSPPEIAIKLEKR